MSLAAPNPSEPVFSVTITATAVVDATTAEPALPDDPQVLKQMIRELLETLRSQRHQNEHLQHRLDLLLRRLYGPRAERFNPDQPLLFTDLQAPADTPADSTTPPANSESPPPPPEPAASTKPTGHGRQRLPKNLRRETVVYDLTTAERLCSGCGQPRTCIGEDRSEQLEYQPASLFVVVHVRPKYACPRCHNGVFTATVAAQPINKGLPGPGLLAHIIVCKFADHLPLYRQESIFSRQGVDLSRQTLCQWLGQAGQLLKPLYQRLKALVLASTVVHTDDTPVPVQEPGKTRTGRIWDYLGDAEHPGNVFDYTPTRSRDGPAKFLEHFRGYLQADAYTGYDQIYVGDQVIEVGCNAHARRKFHEARTTDAAGAHSALAYYRQLYQIEAEAKKRAEERYRAEVPEALPWEEDGLAPLRFVALLYEERYRLRQQKSLPILADFERWLGEQKNAVVPKSPLGEAITYVLNQWQALTRYTQHGFLDIDNNRAERQIRRIAIGRKNWLFLGNDEAGETAAILFSFVSTCQRHGLDAFVYLRDVLRRLPEHPLDRLDELLPGRWQPAATVVPGSTLSGHVAACQPPQQ
jgi:transposase